MTTLTEARKLIGQHIKSDHPYAYKTGEWATIVGVEERPDRIIWHLQWPDGKTDEWAADDPTADYKFRDPFHSVDVALRALTTLQNVTVAVIRDQMLSGIRAPRELREEITRILEDHVDRMPR